MQLLARSIIAAPVELRFVVWDGDESLRVLRRVIGEFEKAHPNIKVRMENVDYKVYFQKLLAQYAANTAPDVAMLDPQNFQRYARRGALADLEPFIASGDGVNLADYYKPIVDVHRYQGKLYVLPRDIAPIGLIYYNKRLFKEAGLTLPDGRWTWDYEPRPSQGTACFTNCLQKLTVKGENGRVKQWAFAPSWVGAFTDTVVFSSGARYVDRPEDFTQLNFTDPRTIKAFDWVASLANQKHWMPSQSEMTSVAQTTAVQLFISQKIAMYQCGIWDVPNIRAALKPGSPEFFDWDITLAPGHIDPATGKVNNSAPTGGSGYGIMQSTAHPKESWELVKWMAGEPGMRAMAEAGIAQPAIRKVALSEAWIPGPNTPIEQQYPASRKFTDIAVPSVVFPPTAEYWMEVSGLAFSKTEPIYTGGTTAKAALTEGNKIANARVTSILRQENLSPFNWKAGIGMGLAIIAAVFGWVFWPELKVKRTKAEKAESRAGFMFISPWILGMVIFTLGPMVLSLLMSTTSWDLIQTAQWRGAGNFAEAFGEDPRFWGSLKVTAIYTAVSVPLGIIVALGLALLLNTKVKGMAIYRTCFYLPALASTVASALIWRKIFQPEGGILNIVLFGSDGQRNPLGLASALGSNGQLPNWLGNEKLALPALIMMSVWSAGGGMIILLAGLQGIPETYYEAATLDGAGPWRKFKAVTFPLLSPSLFFTMITGVIASFQSFTQAFVMTQGGPNDSTRFYMLHLYDEAFGLLRMGYASALGWILFAAIFFVTLAQFRLNRLVHYGGDS
ncbi:MAG: extracellular solute-binding protein [Armatimonadetes bacterium]|nr:extracellular solute-binding protein [Armatimonadota bacterium]